MDVTNSSNKSDIIHSFICAMVVFCAMRYSPPDTAFTLNVRCDGAETGAAAPDGLFILIATANERLPISLQRLPRRILWALLILQRLH